jgi:hypothetical protein
MQEEDIDVTTGAVPDAFRTMFAVTVDRTGAGNGIDGLGLSHASTWQLSESGTAPTTQHTGGFELPFTSTDEDSWSALEIAAEAGDEEAFLRAARQLIWTEQTSSDLVRAVRLALAAGAHMMARHLADYGSRLYPSHTELAKMAHILAPPKTVHVKPNTTDTITANQRWLRQHYAEYKGRWVALRNGELVAAAKTARELRAALPDLNGLMVTIV